MLAPAFLPADGEGADAFLAGFLDGLEEGFAAEGTSGAGDGAEGLVAGVFVEACFEGGASFPGGDGVFPYGGVEGAGVSVLQGNCHAVSEPGDVPDSGALASKRLLRFAAKKVLDLPG